MIFGFELVCIVIVIVGFRRVYPCEMTSQTYPKSSPTSTDIPPAVRNISLNWLLVEFVGFWGGRNQGTSTIRDSNWVVLFFPGFPVFLLPHVCVSFLGLCKVHIPEIPGPGPGLGPGPGPVQGRDQD